MLVFLPKITTQTRQTHKHNNTTQNPPPTRRQNNLFIIPPHLFQNL